MEPTSLIDHAEFWLPPEFLTDDDFILEMENNGGRIDDSNNCLFPNKTRPGFGGFGSTVKPNVRSLEKEGDEQKFLTRQTIKSSLEDNFSGEVCGNLAFPARSNNKVWGMTRSPLCVARTGCCCRNQISQPRISCQAAWDPCCTAVEEVARMITNDELYDYSNHGGRGLLAHPKELSSAAVAVKNHLNNGSGYSNNQSSGQYHKIQAIQQFQQLKQQQLMKHYHQLVQQNRGLGVNSNKNGGPVDLSSSSAWSNPPLRRDGSRMRAVFLEDHTRKRGSTGTGVFLPRSGSHTSRATSRDEKPTLSTVFVPARVAQVLNLNLNEPVRSLASLTDVSWRQRSNIGGFSSQMQGGVGTKQQLVNEPRLPSDWAY